MIEIITQYLIILCPALAGIIGMAALVVVSLKKLNDAITAWKTDASLAELNAKLQSVADENHELNRVNKLLLDKITKIQNYADEVNKK